MPMRTGTCCCAASACGRRGAMTNGAVHTVRSFCRICTSVCGILVDVEGDEVLRVRGDHEHPFSHGYTCAKGRSLPTMHHHPDRIERPMMRVDGELQPTTWDECLDDLGARLNEIIDDHGPAAVGVFFGSGVGMDAAGYRMAQSLHRAIGTPARFSPLTIDGTAKALIADLIGGATALERSARLRPRQVRRAARQQPGGVARPHRRDARPGDAPPRARPPRRRLGRRPPPHRDRPPRDPPPRAAARHRLRGARVPRPRAAARRRPRRSRARASGVDSSRRRSSRSRSSTPRRSPTSPAELERCSTAVRRAGRGRGRHRHRRHDGGERQRHRSGSRGR